MPITPRLFGDRGARRAAVLGIDPDRLPPGRGNPWREERFSVDDYVARTMRRRPRERARG